MLATDGLSSAFAYTNEPIQWIFIRPLAKSEVFVDQAADQGGKADTAATRLVAEPAILLRFE